MNSCNGDDRSMVAMAGQNYWKTKNEDANRSAPPESDQSPNRAAFAMPVRCRIFSGQRELGGAGWLFEA